MGGDLKCGLVRMGAGGTWRVPALSRDGLLLGRYVDTGLIILLLRMFQGGPSIIRRGCRGRGGSDVGLHLRRPVG